MSLCQNISSSFTHLTRDLFFTQTPQTFAEMGRVATPALVGFAERTRPGGTRE